MSMRLRQQSLKKPTVVGWTACAVSTMRKVCTLCGPVTCVLFDVQGASEGSPNIACLRLDHASRGEAGAQHAVRATESGAHQRRQRHGPEWRGGAWRQGRDP